MSASAVVIKFSPPEEGPSGPEQPPRTRQRKGGYTHLDNATDLTLLAELPNALVKPALFLMSRRGLRQPAVHWGEVAAFCQRGQTQTSDALKALADLGYAVSEGGLWRWENRVSPGNPPETRRKPGMDAPENNVPDEKKPTPELRNKGNKEIRNNNTITGRLSAGEAMRRVEAAGLRPIWEEWVRLSPLSPVTQDAQLVYWAERALEGRADALRAAAREVIDLGTYVHPFAGLRALMNKTGREPAKGSAPGGPPAGGTPDPSGPQPGERRTAPDGQVWTVEEVSSGVVIFEESHAPHYTPADTVAAWPREEGTPA